MSQPTEVTPSLKMSEASRKSTQFSLDEKQRCDHPKATSKGLLGWILRVFFRPGRTYVGDRLQPILDNPEGRARVDEEGSMYSHAFILISERQSIRQSFIEVQPLLNKSTLMECLAA